MAVAARQYNYEYEGYRGGPARRTPPLNVSELRYEINTYTESTAPLTRPAIVPDAPVRAPRRRDNAEFTRRVHYPRISTKSKVITFMLIFFAGLVLFGIIMLSSYQANIRYEINRAKTETASVQEDIDELRVAIEKGNNIDIIEQTAMNELGMEYPAAKQIVYLEDVNEATNDEV
jgi:hypothetical protein